MTDIDVQAVSNLAGRVKARHCEPGGDRSSYLLAIQAGNLLARLAEVEAERDAARADVNRLAVDAANLTLERNALADALTTHTDLLDEARQQRDDASNALALLRDAVWSGRLAAVPRGATTHDVMATGVSGSWLCSCGFAGSGNPATHIAAVDAYRAATKAPETAPESRQDDERAEVLPEWQYVTTQGPRKAWDGWDTPPDGEGWERDLNKGHNGWERFDYHEESYWRRPAPTETDQPAPITTDPSGLDAAIEAAWYAWFGDERYVDREMAERAVRAAAPALRAGALREAADEFRNAGYLIRRGTETEWDMFERWLRERADRIGGTS